MAGKFEEPFRFYFQANLLHSGSISFGRFESESLSWEKRSYFSHNRYLEEVEKYSKPGGSEHLKLEKTHQIIENAVLVKGEENTRESLDDMDVMVDVASEAKNSSLSSHTADKDDDRANYGTQQLVSSKF